MILHDDDIMGFDPVEMDVTGWTWRTHMSRTSGKEMLKATYFGNLSDQPIVEYFPVTHDGYAGEKARQSVAAIADKAGVDYRFLTGMDFSAKQIESGTPPAVIKFKRDGKFFRVLRRQWDT
jgi:DNA repair protein RadD